MRPAGVERKGMKLRESKLRWYGHEDYLGRRAMEIELRGRRKKGRLERMFMADDMNELELLRVKDAKNRNSWRDAVHCGSYRIKQGR